MSKKNFYQRIFLMLIGSLLVISCTKNNWDNPFDASTSLAGSEWQPINVQVAAPSIAKRLITWDYNGKTIAGFKIDRKMGDGEWQKVYALVEPHIREWIDTMVVPEKAKTVIYRIYSFASTNVSAYVEVASFTEIDAPSNFQAVKIDDFTYRLSWADNSEGEHGFKLAKRIDNGEWNNQYAQLAANTVSFVDSSAFSVKSAANIQYKITSFYQTYSSQIISVNTNASLTPPSNLTAELNNQLAINLTWKDNSTGEDGFMVERKKEFGTWELIGKVTQANFTDSENIIGEITLYRVSSYYGEYNSDYCESSFYLALLAPTSLAIQSLSIYKSCITWYDNSIGEDGFKIERKINDGPWQYLGDTTAAVYYDNSLELNSLISYRICSYKKSMLSDFSEVSYNSTIPSPTNISGTYMMESNSMEIQWEDACVGEQGFAIDRKRANSSWHTNYHIANANASSFVDTVSMLVNYTYRIRAFANGSYSSYAEIDLGAHPFGIEMLLVEGGTFQMGCTSEQSDCESDESPVHTVTLSSYYLSKTEITQKQWHDIVGTQPSIWTGCDNCPVENMNWDMLSTFLTALSSKTGLSFKLPTEAQWEFAARGGIHAKLTKFSGSNNLDSVAWHGGNSSYKPQQVAQKKPNELGLYDMSGNVMEWCSDYYGTYSSANLTNPTGPSTGSMRVLRGGHHTSPAKECRNSERSTSYNNTGSSFYGFRVAIMP
jgi:formylglycine-generating enzyme required for sulfatase activity